MRKINKGEKYKHFKNKDYRIINIVNDCESTDENIEKIVIYKALYGTYETWARKYDDFISEVDHNKYPEVKQKYRFQKQNKNESILLITKNKKIKEKFVNISIDEKLNIEELHKYDMLIMDYDNNIELGIYIGLIYSMNIPIYIIKKEDDMINEEILKYAKTITIEEIENII